jgi:serine phosphatase RsbU (regulator of sigma subunit)
MSEARERESTARHDPGNYPNLACASVDMWTSPASGARDGGDWCDTVSLSERELALTVGDVSGHGDAVAGIKSTIRRSVLHEMQRTRLPSDVMACANGVVCANARDSIVTAVVGFFDGSARTLTFANAGHPPPLLVTDERHGFLTRPHANLPLGVFSRHATTNTVVTLPAGAIVVVYTDGVTESARDPIKGELDLIEAARLAYDRPESDAALAIANHVFAAGRGLDDAAILVLRTWPLRVRHARNAAP